MKEDHRTQVGPIAWRSLLYIVTYESSWKKRGLTDTLGSMELLHVIAANVQERKHRRSAEARDRKQQERQDLPSPPSISSVLHPLAKQRTPSLYNRASVKFTPYMFSHMPQARTHKRSLPHRSRSQRVRVAIIYRHTRAV